MTPPKKSVDVSTFQPLLLGPLQDRGYTQIYCGRNQSPGAYVKSQRSQDEAFGRQNLLLSRSRRPLQKLLPAISLRWNYLSTFENRTLKRSLVDQKLYIPFHSKWQSYTVPALLHPPKSSGFLQLSQVISVDAVTLYNNMCWLSLAAAFMATLIGARLALGIPMNVAFP